MTVKKFIPFLCLCGIGIILFRTSKNDTPFPKLNPSGMTIYDTAILMLHEFVAESNDTNLGFSNAEEVLKAHVAVDSGMPMYILGKGIRLHKNPKDTAQYKLHMEMERLRRVIYPVYVGNVLHSAITFDSAYVDSLRILYWRPVMFDAGDIFTAYQNDFETPATPAQGVRTYSYVMTPALHTHLIFRHDNTGDYIIPTKEVIREMRENFPNSANRRPFAAVRREEFFDGLDKHIQKKASQRKQ